MIPVNSSTQYLMNNASSERETRKQSEEHSGEHSVWYRTFLKPLIRKHRVISYRESYHKRVVHSVGVPVGEIQGLHALFKEEYRHYSPLYGMIFTYNNYINNLYRYGDTKEPAVELIRQLFHVLPGGEIQPTHAGRNAGAHLTTGIIGDIFDVYERHKDQLVPCNDNNALEPRDQLLAERLAQLISQHPDYLDNTQKLNDDAVTAQAALQVLEQKEADAEPVRQRIKELEGDVVKANRHHIKRLKKEQKKAAANDKERHTEIAMELARREDETKAAEAELKELRTQIVTSLDFKVARKNLKRAQDAVELERTNRRSLAQAIATSFCTHELGISSGTNGAKLWNTGGVGRLTRISPSTESNDKGTSNLPHFSTTAILLAYLWRKYDSITAFQGYFEAMDHMGALNVHLIEAMELIENHAAASSDESSHTGSASSGASHHPTGVLSMKTSAYRINRCARIPRRVWSATDIETATTITTGTPGNLSRPPVILFSYVTWAAYSAFPDCGETALRNLFNQIVYNPDSGKFDHEVLQDLQERFYPELSDVLIDFYRRNDKPQDATLSHVAVEWIDVVSKLNSFRGWNKKDHDHLFIRYRREEEEQNIASPLRNALRVVNALFGVTDIDGAQLVLELVDHINNLRDTDVEVDLAGVKDDGFGILAISDGKVRYELQSYKPVHFGFVQAETMKTDSRSRCDFRRFRRLMRHSNTPPRATPNTPQYFEQLALASLFVPYQLQRKQKVGKFFRNAPAHYALLFADLDSETHKHDAVMWATVTPAVASNAQVQTLLRNLETYKEPVFAPTKKTDKKQDDHEQQHEQTR